MYVHPALSLAALVLIVIAVASACVGMAGSIIGGRFGRSMDRAASVVWAVVGFLAVILTVIAGLPSLTR